jgi:hypothetical protein
MKHTRNTQYTPKPSPELRKPKQPPDPLQGGINNLTFLATQQTRQKSTRRPPTHQIRHQHTNSTSGGAETRAPPSPNSKNDRTKHNHERSTKTRERKKRKIEEERKKRKKWAKPEKKELWRRTRGAEGLSPPRRTTTTTWSTLWKMVWIECKL